MVVMPWVKPHGCARQGDVLISKYQTHIVIFAWFAKKHRGYLSQLLWVIYEEKRILYKMKNFVFSKSIRYIMCLKLYLFVQDFGTTSSYLWHEWDIKSCRILCDVMTFEYPRCSYLRKEQVIKPYSSMWDVITYPRPGYLLRAPKVMCGM